MLTVHTDSEVDYAFTVVQSLTFLSLCYRVDDHGKLTQHLQGGLIDAGYTLDVFKCSNYALRHGHLRGTTRAWDAHLPTLSKMESDICFIFSLTYREIPVLPHI